MTMEPVNESTRLPDAVHRKGVPVEAFNPLLRSLLTWGLVERKEDGENGHHWALIADAQARLDELTPRPRRSSAALAYLDHWCARCRQQRLTHLIEGRYLCEDCQRAESSSGSALGSAPEPKRPRHSPENVTHRVSRRAQTGH